MIDDRVGVDWKLLRFRLRRYLEVKNTSYRQLASVTGLHVSSITCFLQGKKVLSADNAIALMMFLNPDEPFIFVRFPGE